MLVAELSFHLEGIDSLKDKRRLRQSLIERLSRTYRSSAAEVADQDRRDTLSVGVALVGSDRRVLEKTMDRIVAQATREIGDPFLAIREFR